jgi:hypothetical protein
MPIKDYTTQPIPLNFDEHVATSHENRIQKLETEVLGVSTKLATIEVTTDYIKEQINTGFDNISNKIEDCVGVVAKRLDDHIGKSNDIWGKVDQLTVIHEQEKIIHSNKLAKKITLKKGIWALVIAAVGIVISESIRILMMKGI